MRLLEKGITVSEAIKLFEADCTRQPYAAGCERFVVSPRIRAIGCLRSSRARASSY